MQFTEPKSGLGKSLYMNTSNKKNKINKTNKKNKTLKKMSCSPLVDDLKLSNNTCYTKDILFQIKDD